jgi:hypothetical protein
MDIKTGYVQKFAKNGQVDNLPSKKSSFPKMEKEL